MVWKASKGMSASSGGGGNSCGGSGSGGGDGGRSWPGRDGEVSVKEAGGSGEGSLVCYGCELCRERKKRGGQGRSYGASLAEVGCGCVAVA